VYLLGKTSELRISGFNQVSGNTISLEDMEKLLVLTNFENLLYSDRKAGGKNLVF